MRDRLSLFLITMLAAVNATPENGGLDAKPDYEWHFPRDHAAHPDYQTEWWYFSGIVTSDHREFGFQFTIFRIRTGADVREGSDWFTNQVLLGHMAISDLERGAHCSFSRKSRAHPSLVDIDESMPGTMRLRDWSLSFDGAWSIEAAHSGHALYLRLSPSRPVLFQGPNGYSRKGPNPGQASQYYSQTRLKTEGRLRVEGETFQVRGRTWFDHEFGSNELGQEQVGWDWVSLRLSDGSDLMVGRLREKEGGITPQSSATLRRQGEEVQYIPANEWSMEPMDYWRSSETDARYPVRWRLTIPEFEIELSIQSYFNSQEMVSEDVLSDPYWEGVIKARGKVGKNKVTGKGYLEMTGYASSTSDAPAKGAK